jgi:endonuclease/exonuclease/phosphatase family metal-dependent hydrolase
MATIKVLTLNIWNQKGPSKERIALIRRTIEALSPDVVGLQEVIVDGTWSQADEIGSDLGYASCFGRASAYPSGALFGNAILSKLPIDDHFTFELPSPGTEPRSVVYARLRTLSGQLPFYSTHLAWKFEEGVLRERQALAVSRAVKATARAEDLPAVLVGDLNTKPEATEIRFLKGLHSLDGESVHFTDCFEAVGEGPGFTFDPTRNPHAALTHELPRRIDFVLVRGPDDFGRGKPLSCRVVCEEVETLPDGQRYAASDHYGVFAEIQV